MNAILNRPALKRLSVALAAIGVMTTLLMGASAMEKSAAAKPAHVIVLMQSVGFEHDVVKARDDGGSVVEDVWRKLDAANDTFTCDYIRDAAALTKETLADTDVLVFYTTGKLPIPGGAAALAAWVKSGGKLLGIHCATDTLKDDPDFTPLINGTFDGHPWTADTIVTVKPHDAKDPLVTMYDQNRTFKEEIYQFKNHEPTRSRVHMSLDMEKTERKKPYHVPICWTHEMGQGRVFYTSLGHREDIWQSAAFQQHLTAGMNWLLGQIEVDSKPDPALHAREMLIAKRAVAEQQQIEAQKSKDQKSK